MVSLSREKYAVDGLNRMNGQEEGGKEYIFLYVIGRDRPGIADEIAIIDTESPEITLFERRTHG
jgi:hypothetical protein